MSVVFKSEMPLFTRKKIFDQYVLLVMYGREILTLKTKTLYNPMHSKNTVCSTQWAEETEYVVEDCGKGNGYSEESEDIKIAIK